VLKIRKNVHIEEKKRGGIAVTDLLAAPMDLVARALNAHTVF
jgi:hypothetical protein